MHSLDILFRSNNYWHLCTLVTIWHRYSQGSHDFLIYMIHLKLIVRHYKQKTSFDLITEYALLEKCRNMMHLKVNADLLLFPRLYFLGNIKHFILHKEEKYQDILRLLMAFPLTLWTALKRICYNWVSRRRYSGHKRFWFTHVFSYSYLLHSLISE